MNPEQIEQHCLFEIERAKTLLDFIQNQSAPPSDRIRAALADVAYRFGIAAEPVGDADVTEVDNGSSTRLPG